MNILEFSSEEYGIDLIEGCNSNSNLHGELTISLTILLTNSNTGKKWCYREHLENVDFCSGNETLNTSLINQYIADEKCLELEKTNQQLIDEFYLDSNYMP